MAHHIDDDAIHANRYLDRWRASVCEVKMTATIIYLDGIDGHEGPKTYDIEIEHSGDGY
jgi:hypothetical protein